MHFVAGSSGKEICSGESSESGSNLIAISHKWRMEEEDAVHIGRTYNGNPLFGHTRRVGIRRIARSAHLGNAADGEGSRGR